VDMVRVAHNLMRFYHHESCGQCTPCREGCGWLEKILARFVAGAGRPGEIEQMLDICDNMAFKTICPLGDAARMPTESYLHKFGAEFAARIAGAAAAKGD
jgi:NADH-quinone oxidoreductase subunit F